MAAFGTLRILMVVISQRGREKVPKRATKMIQVFGALFQPVKAKTMGQGLFFKNGMKEG